MVALYIIICVIIIGLAYCFSETTRFKVTEYDYESSKVSGETDGTRIVLLSDLHCKTFGHNNERLFDTVKELKPDLIIIAGDLINGLPAGQYEKGCRYAVDFLTGLKDIGCPVYYEFGNHELKLKRISDKAYQDYIDTVSPLCTLLNNDYISFSDEFNIYGLMLHRKLYKGKVSDHRRKLKIRPYLGKCNTSVLNIMIAHDPSFADKYFRWGADLVLSGHYHGGIIRIPFLGGIISPRYSFFPKPDKGKYIRRDQCMIISGGLGWHDVPFRFNNLPEIVAITLHTKSN